MTLDAVGEMLGVPVKPALVFLLFASIGYVVHVVMKVADLRDADSSMTIGKYFSQNPYRHIGKFGAVLLAAWALVEPTVTPMVAVGAAGIGFAADSAGNRIKVPTLK